MAMVQITVRLGGTSKVFKGSQRRIEIGKAPGCDLLLPFKSLRDHHLTLENRQEGMRVKAALEESSVTLSGVTVGTGWIALPNQANLDVAISGGRTIVLEITSTPGPKSDDLGAFILRDAPVGGQAAAREDDLDVQFASGGVGIQGAGTFNDIAELSSGAPVVPAAEPVRIGQFSSTAAIWMTAGLYVVLIVCALGFNRYRQANARRIVEADTSLVNDQLAKANDLIRSRDYVGAKAAIDVAEPAAQRQPTLAPALAEIERLRGKPEIRYGAEGYEQVDDQWLPANIAHAYRTARERDDPRIAQLERMAAEAQASKRYEQGRLACDQAIALMEAMPVKPHPRYSAIKAQRDGLASDATAAEMTAKGLVQYQGRWVMPDEKIRLEQEAKGLVQYQGQWMTKDQVAEAQAKGDNGMVFFNGKWMTPDDKMKADGYVQFEGKWVKPPERDKILADRKAEEVASKQAEAHAEALKRVAYTNSQACIRASGHLPAAAKFQDFNDGKVSVVFDDGWYIVRGVVTMANGKSERTYYCRLRPKNAEGTEWEESTTLFAD